jgi:rare lipoprotein A
MKQALLLPGLFLLVAATPAAHALDLALDTALETQVKGERGVASYYAKRFDGRRTASGQIFRNDELMAAHPTLPFGTIVRVTNVDKGSFVDVRITDRGGFAKSRAIIIDLSQAAAARINMLSRGTARVVVEVLDWGGRKSHQLADAAAKVTAGASGD